MNLKNKIEYTMFTIFRQHSMRRQTVLTFCRQLKNE